MSTKRRTKRRGFYGPKKKGGVVVGWVGSGEKKKKIVVKKYKYVPSKCSVPRQICICCFKSVIRKNDLNYESKICKGCSSTGLVRSAVCSTEK